MILEHFLLSINETNAYIVACTETGEAAVIDPGEWNSQLAGFLLDQKLTLKWALITHGHADHTGGIEAIRQSYPEVKIAAHPLFSGSDLRLTRKTAVPVGKLSLRVLETPGHTADSISFAVGNDVFCGDALFAGSVGGTNSPEEYTMLIQSIRQQLLPLGDDMVLHPGHGPATTILIERLFNPFLMA